MPQDNKNPNQPAEKVKCPFCKEIEIEIPENAEVGDFLECNNCAAEVEVISVDPVRIRIILEEK
jgi:lysine biosynthesis protein LysW